ncbi:hypothetical protein DKX38_003524 [Salix brachista]|uniref:Longin domain-containing protein n=1 Tax=Salix brachista TaxID=2182728 RepID=A0A5N5NSP4_9ROSI|nr:hypothetical protein DKX38_003524 [Salix brachista]
MGQQSLIYSFVARGKVILADYTDFSGNFASIAAQCLQKLPATNNKFTYNCDGHTFNYLVDNGFTYCVVAVESVGRQIPIAYLERVKEDFTNRYGGGKAAIAVANSLNKEYGPKLKEQMQYCMDHPEEVSKLAKVKAQVSEVLDRGGTIELLVDKTENLRHQAFSVAMPFDSVSIDHSKTYSNEIVIYEAPTYPKLKDFNAFAFVFIMHDYGTRFQADRNPDKEENVVAEHENKDDSVGDLDCLDSHHSIVYMWRLQMLNMIYLYFLGATPSRFCYIVFGFK